MTRSIFDMPRRNIKISLAILIVAAPAIFFYCRTTTISIEDKVSFLIDETTKSADRERNAFKELESMRETAIPYIISHLNDMRPLADREISVRNNFPGAFESHALFGPEIVHDALSILLGQMTNRECAVGKGDMSSSKLTFRIRQINRSQWIRWCKTHYPSQSDICGNEEKGYEADLEKLCLD